MEKYLGLVKVYQEGMSGVTPILLSKTYSDIDILNKWFDLYPDSERVVLLNTAKLDSMFFIFKDYTPVTEEEKAHNEEMKKVYKKLKKS